MMRTFLSLTPDPDTAVAISDWATVCWPTVERLVPMQNYHVTMAFLGDVDESAYEAVVGNLDSKNFGGAFECCFNDVGYWPDSRALWLGCRGVPVEIDALAGTCRNAANKAGIKVGSKRFKPHLTLARKPTVVPGAPLIDAEFTIRFDSLQLYQSILDRNGARYVERHCWPL